MRAARMPRILAARLKLKQQLCQPETLVQFVLSAEYLRVGDKGQMVEGWGPSYQMCILQTWAVFLRISWLCDSSSKQEYILNKFLFCLCFYWVCIGCVFSYMRCLFCVVRGTFPSKDPFILRTLLILLMRLNSFNEA